MIHSWSAKEWICYDSDSVFATLYWMYVRHFRASVWEYLLWRLS